MNPLIQLKKAIPPSAHLLRGAFYLLLLVAVCAIPFAVAQPNATRRSLAKLGSASKGLVGGGNALLATTVVVTNTNDSGPGSLRDALSIANDGDTIDATGVSGIILLTSGELQINHNVTINGPGVGTLAVNGNAGYRVFENFGSNVSISGFTITNGLSDSNGGGGILNHGVLTLSDSIVSNCATPTGNNHGGGISNNPGAILTVTGSTINGNYAGCEGGGIYSSNAQLTVTNSTISSNFATSRLACGGNGGGIFYNGGGTVIVANSVISGNGTLGAGGGMGSDLPGGTTATITNSTISDNSADGLCELCGAAGGILNAGQTLTVTNSTISGNSARSQGGGISNSGSLTVINSTLSGNSAGYFGGGGINNGGTAQIGDTVLNAGAFGGTIVNQGGTVTSLGYNLASDDGGGVLTGPGDQINTDPMLGPLQDNGGPTFTHALSPGSPAIDAGDPNFTPPPFYDQRGSSFPRVVNGRIDIGSFEVQLPMAQDAFSRKVHGAAGTFDIPLPLSGSVGVECRTGGPTNDYQMIVDFPSTVTVESVSVTSGTGTVSSFTGSGTSQITINLTGVTNVQVITVTLHNVNNGTSTGDVPVSMGVLIGDVNGNATVNSSDVSVTKSQVGQTVGSGNFREDVNASGTITSTDVAVVKSDVGTSLPP